MSRFVFDANVIISAFLSANSNPALALDWALRNGTVLLSSVFIDELFGVIASGKFDRYSSFDARNLFVQTVVDAAERVEITEAIQACRDPDDDKILELAVSGGAAYIVTGDADLLALNPFRGIAVVTPAEFLALFA